MDPEFVVPAAAEGSIGLGGLFIGDAACSVNPIVQIARDTQFRCIAESMQQMTLKHNRDYNVFQIPSKSIFLNAMKSAGIVDVDFKLTNCGGCFGVTITFTVGGRRTTASGDLSKTPELAEAAAIDRAFVLLSKMHNFRLVDITARKQKEFVRIGRALYHKILTKLCVVNWLIWKWRNSVSNFSAVQLYAQQKTKEANRFDAQFADILLNKFLLIKGGSLINIESFDDKIKALVYEKNRYAVASRSKPFCSSMVATRKMYYPDVESLALFMKWLRLDPCKYSSKIAENGMWIGVAHICLPDGNHSIPAKQPKGSIPKAYNAAAREVISFLERLFNVNVAGYNHAACVTHDQVNYVWKGLNEELLRVGTDVLESWQEMVLKLSHFVKEQKNTLSKLGSSSNNELANLVTALGTANEICRQSLKVAAAKFGTLD